MGAFELTKKGRFTKLAKQWEKSLAPAHARADNDFDDKRVPYPFEKRVVKVLGDDTKKFQKLVREIASSHATQVINDWESWKATGQVPN